PHRRVFIFLAAMSQSISVLSLLADTKCLLSGLNANDQILLPFLWPSKVANSLISWTPSAGGLPTSELLSPVDDFSPDFPPHPANNTRLRTNATNLFIRIAVVICLFTRIANG